jgi:hypothetical protein
MPDIYIYAVYANLYRRILLAHVRGTPLLNLLHPPGASGIPPAPRHLMPARPLRRAMRPSGDPLARRRARPLPRRRHVRRILSPHRPPPRLAPSPPHVLGQQPSLKTVRAPHRRRACRRRRAFLSGVGVPAALVRAAARACAPRPEEGRGTGAPCRAGMRSSLACCRHWRRPCASRRLAGGWYRRVPARTRLPRPALACADGVRIRSDALAALRKTRAGGIRPPALARDGTAAYGGATALTRRR